MVKHRIEYGISWTEMKFCLDAKWYHIYVCVCTYICMCMCVYIYIYSNAMDMNLGKLWEMVRDREAWRAYSPWGSRESDTTW